MTAKEYLKQIRIINMQLKSMRRQVQSLADAATNISPILSDMPKAATADIHRMENLIVTKVDLENEAAAKSDKLAEITRKINSLPDPMHVAIITSRYICNMEWRDIACEMHISEGRIFQLHRDALAELEKSIAGYS